MRIRIVTLNVWNLEGDPRRQAVMNAELRRLDADLVSLQEVVQAPGRDQLDDLLVATGLHGSHQWRTTAYELPDAERFGGTALATRWPHRVLETIDMRVRGAGTPHPWGAVGAVVDLPGVGDLLFIAATSSPFDERARERQAIALTDLDSRHRRMLPTIIAGDLNATPEAASMRYLTGLQSLDGQSARFEDPWAIVGEGPGHTWTPDNPNASRRYGPRRRIDHILVGSFRDHPRSHVHFESAALAFDQPVDGVWPSDHLGVVVDLDITSGHELT